MSEVFCDDTIAWTQIEIADAAYARLPVRTPWLEENDNLASVVRTHAPAREPGDTVVISEKVALLLTGRALPIDIVQPGRLAHLLARRVKPRQGSRGLSVPEKMQYVLQTVGIPRLLLATGASAATRPFGVRGVFYRLTGPIARDLDGGRPPYEDRLFPPFPSPQAHTLCAELDEELGLGVAIVDMNDYGGSIRAVSQRSFPEPILAAALADNPLQQRLASTPIGLLRQL